MNTLRPSIPRHRPARCALGLLLACAMACHETGEPGPRPSTVAPVSGMENAPTRITITGEGLLPLVRTDFANGGASTLDATFHVRLGATPLLDVAPGAPGTLDATVPAGLAPGRYTLTVMDPEGREGALPDAFEVHAPLEPTARVAGFRFESIGPQRAHEPFALTVQAVDAAGERVAGFNGTARLTDETGTIVPATLGPFRDGTWSGNVEVRRGTAANVLTLTTEGGQGRSDAFSVAVREAVALRFDTPPRTFTAGECSEPLTLVRVDDLGQPASSGAEVELSIEEDVPRALALYADAACTARVERLGLAPDASALTFHLRRDQAGAGRLTARTTGLRSTSQSLDVRPGSPARLDFLTEPGALDAGHCSTPVLVEVRDAHGNATPVAQALPLEFLALPSPGFTFHTDPGCTGAAASLAVPSGEARLAVHFRATVAGAVQVRASASGLQQAEQHLTIHPESAPTQLVFLTTPHRKAAGRCSGELRVQAQDSLGNAAPNPGGLQLSLASTVPGSLTFYADAACTRAVTGLALPDDGSTEAGFHFRGTVTGAVTLTVSAPGLSSASQGATVDPGPPERLTVDTPPRVVAAGQCSQALGLRLLDAQGNTAPAPGALTVTLAGTPPEDLHFFSDAACTRETGTLVLGTGESTGTFYIRSLRAGGVTLTASGPGLTSVSQGATITSSGTATDLVFTTSPQSVVAGACSPAARLQSRDAFGNVQPVTAALTVNLGASPAAGFLFYSDASCTTSVTAVVMAANTSSGTFHFRGTRSGTVTLTATATGLAPATQAATVTPAPARRLAFTTPSRTGVAGACSPLASLQARDAFDNPSPVSSATAVSLGASPATGFTFFEDAGCTRSASGVTLPAAGAGVDFYFRGTAAGTVSVTASVPGWSSATQSQALIAGPATELAWDSFPSPQRVDAPFAVTLRARDAHGNPVTSFTGTATLASLPSAPVTCITGCSSTSTTGAFNSGVWTGSVTVGAPAGTGRRLTATSGSLGGTSAAFDVQPLSTDTPPVASFTFNPAVIVAGQSIAFDATGSDDNTTPDNALEVSWDFTGTAPGNPPWSAWTTTKTATQAFSTPGTYTVRLAVRDAPGGVGYAFRQVMVLPAGARACVVDTPSRTDDGASTCAGPFGADGKLSLPEAVRLSNVTTGRQVITFNGPMTLSNLPALTLTDAVDVLAPSGVTLELPTLTVRAAAVQVSGVSMTGSNFRITVEPGATLTLLDSTLTGGRVLVQGSLVLHRASVSNCDQRCLELNGASASAVVRYSNLYTLDLSRNVTGILMTACTSAGVALDVQSSVLGGLDWGISQGCGTVRLLHNTFYYNTVGLRLQSGGGHVVRNNIFASHATQAVDCGAAAFASRDFHLLSGNDSNGCVGGDANTLTGSPLFVGLLDVRIQYASPARDSAVDLGLDVNDAAPGLYFGAGPDRGAHESF
jgi:hypothetical protein